MHGVLEERLHFLLEKGYCAKVFKINHLSATAGVLSLVSRRISTSLIFRVDRLQYKTTASTIFLYACRFLVKVCSQFFDASILHVH